MDLTSLCVDTGSVGRHSTVVELGVEDSSTVTVGGYCHTIVELRVEDSSTAGTYAQPNHIENYAGYHLPAVPSDTHMTDHRDVYPWESCEIVNIVVNAYFHFL